jgi:PAS domain S-box-containing protein
VYVVGVAAIGAAYYLAARLGVGFALSEQNVALIRPPIGVVVALLYRAGLRFWPGVFAGALAAALHYSPVWAAVGIAGGNTAGAVAAVALLRGFGFDRAFSGRRDLYAFLFAAVIGCAVAATSSMVWIAAARLVAPDLLATGWLLLLIGGVASVLVAAPPILLAALPPLTRMTAQHGLGLFASAALAALVFTDALPPGYRPALIFLPLLVLIWVGTRAGLAVGSLHVLVLSLVAVVGTASGQGLLGTMAPPLKVGMLWATTTAAALIVLSITAALAQRERAEVTLAAVASDYQALVDGTPAAIVRYTAEGRLTFVNQTLCRLLGIPRDSLIGQSVLALIPNMPRGETTADLPVAEFYTGPADGASGMLRKSDGSCRWYRWTARQITTPDGRTEFQAVGIDLTERRNAESERAAIERKMQDAQRLEALGVLAGGVAHDFNNLLAGVLGHAELAVGELPSGHPARDHLATVLSGIAQAGGLTRQLLAYSGKGRFMLRSLDLNELITQTTELLRLTLPKKVRLELNLSEHIAPVTGDDGQIRQVLMNLIINAGEAIGDKPGTVTVTTTGQELALDAVSGGVYSPATPGRFVELIVSDTGCGMDEVTKKRLFDPFFTTKFAGRGLGLSAVLGIIRGHGGGIRVESQPGVGTRFTVLLPASTEPALAAITASAPPPGNVVDASALAGRRARRSGPIARPAPRAVPPEPRTRPAAPPARKGLAIVADDEPTVRQVGELMLKQLGFDVLTAGNGQEAVELFEVNAQRVKLVLLDLMMPVMDGPEALGVIRSHSKVPVILCSGYTAEAVPEELSGDRVTGFLQKPFSRADLQKALVGVGV